MAFSAVYVLARHDFEYFDFRVDIFVFRSNPFSGELCVSMKEHIKDGETKVRFGGVVKNLPSNGTEISGFA